MLRICRRYGRARGATTVIGIVCCASRCTCRRTATTVESRVLRRSAGETREVSTRCGGSCRPDGTAFRRRSSRRHGHGRPVLIGLISPSGGSIPCNGAVPAIAVLRATVDIAIMVVSCLAIIRGQGQVGQATSGTQSRASMVGRGAASRL